MSASQVLDLAERKGLLDAKVIVDLRRQVAESKFIVTPEAIAKILVDHGHLTPFQARKLVSEALGESEPAALTSSPAPVPPSTPVVSTPAPATGVTPPSRPASSVDEDSLAQLADEPASATPPSRKPVAPPADDEIVDLELGEEESPSLLSPPAKPLIPGSSGVGQPPRRPAVAADDDVVDLELSLPAPAAGPTPTAPKSSSKSSGSKSTSKPAGQTPSPVKPVLQPIPAPATPSPLTPIAPSPLTSVAPRPLTPVNAPADLFGGPALSPLGGGDLMPGSPFGAPEANAANSAKKESKKKAPKNKWDSPLLLLGGGGLGLMLIVAAFLFYSLTRGNAAEAFKQAEADYNSGSLASAMDKLDQFIKSNPTGPNSSMARVLRGMAELRANSEEGRNPVKGLKSAQEVLPRIKDEEAFPEARLFLRPILSDIAKGYAELALKSEDNQRRQELVKMTEEALQLVRNAEYIPSSLLGEIMPQIAMTEDKLKSARRSIDQDADRVTSLTKIEALIGEGKSFEAYEERRALLRKYPNLESDPDVIAITQQTSEGERLSVKVLEEAKPASTEAEAPAVGGRTVLAIRSGGKIAGRAGKVVVVPLLGAAYGVSLEDGSLIWRRYFDFDEKHPPTPVSRDVGSDVIVSSLRTGELVRIEAATGKTVWRFPLTGNYAAPVVVGDKLFVTLESGQIVEVDLATGNSARQVQTPQKLALACGADTNSRNPRLIQVGDHSTVFSLQVDTLECTSTVYLGHRPGTIRVPPVAVLGNILVAESRTEEFSEVHVLIPSPENKKQLTAHSEKFRLKGRVVSPIVVSGRRAVVVSDLGHVILLEADTGSIEKPFRVVGEVEAAETSPVYPYAQMDGARLWVFSLRATGFEIQSTQEKISRKWTSNKDDTFVAPPILLEDAIVHVRRRAGTSGYTIEASALEDGNRVLWAVDLGSSLVHVGANEAAKQLVGINSRGQVFEFSSDALSKGVVDQASFQPLGSVDQWLLNQGHQVTSDLWCATGIKSSARAVVYRKGTEADRIKQVELAFPAEDAVGGAAAFDEGLLVPLRIGQILHLDVNTGAPKLFPFQPELAAGKKVNWLKPAVFADRKEFIVSDGESALYRIGVKDQPRPFLASLKEVNLAVKVVGPIAAAGSVVATVTREEAVWKLVLVDAKDLQTLATKPMEGAPSWGPIAVEKTIAYVDSARGLVALDADGSELWVCNLEGSQLVGEPIVQGTDWIVTTSRGKLLRIKAVDGTITSQVDCGEAILAPRYLLNERLILTGYDGTLMMVPLPPKK